MSPIHDDLLSEIDSARKLAAEFTNRSTSGGKTSKRTEGGTDDDEDVRELAAEEARIAELARERVARKEKARAEAKAMAEEMRALRESIASDKERSRLEAAAVLRELEKAKADERAAAEESIRKAIEAGLDILAIANNSIYDETVMQRGVDVVRGLVTDGVVSVARIEESAARIQTLKQRLADNR